MTYGSECWPIKKQHANKLHAAEMRMLRWAGGVTILDHIKNSHVSGSFRVTPIQEKLTENRLRWYGPAMRSHHMTRRVLEMSEKPRGRGRPKTRWMALIQKDLKEANNPAETTQDRHSW
ncbi:uncharacterized protein LOC133523125 [Cydia pomonella]|uniref:uncharacterized protein LOC133523125 n=1 Tax=Cydia pomonella TaxID=82600 RepID=UPI002ADE713C|nr:uncharacterized protein LOC133523125 [Cydia pomonella]